MALRWMISLEEDNLVIFTVSVDLKRGVGIGKRGLIIGGLLYYFESSTTLINYLIIKDTQISSHDSIP